jgi:hypothetical protein
MHSLATRQSLRALLPVCAFSICIFICGKACAADGVKAPAAGARSSDASNAALSAPHIHSTSKLPLSFEVNRGQVDARAKFLARSRGLGLFMTDHGAVMALSETAHRDDLRLPSAQFQRDGVLPRTTQSLGLRYRFAHANPHPKIEALEPLLGHSNYFIGNDPKYWRTNIAQYRRVRYHDVYPGVDVVYYGKDGQLEFDVEAAAGVDLAQVRLQVDGADTLALDEEGNLQLHTALGVLTQSKPVVYQMIAGTKRELRGDYVLRDVHRDGHAHAVSFAVRDYDPAYALVLDPSLVFAKLIGGTGTDDANGVAMDAGGNSYLTGYTNSIGFPTTVGAYQTPGRAGYDAFLTKISADGTTLIYSALIGGSSSDFAYGIGVDGTGQAYITGYTVSSNFPTVNALQSTNPGLQSGFVTALNAAGNALIYSTYLGGNNGSTINEAIAVDPAGNAYVTGLIYGPGLPVSAGTFQASNGGGEDAFVFKFDPAGARVYGTYLGGAGGEEGRAIAVDGDGDAYVAGGTNSTSFNSVTLTTIGPLGGTFAMLIAELNPAGTGLVYATKIGGDQQDEAIGVAVDGGHQVYFTAFSNSHNLPPATPPQYAGGLYEAYIGHLDDSGTVLYDFTWYGSTSAQDYGYAVDLDESRQSLYVVGQIQTLFPGDTTLGGTQSINAVPGLDCGSSCAASTGAFLLQYTLNPLTRVSATRVTGGGATSNAIFTAVAHDAVSGNVAAVGSSDGNPPTTVTPHRDAGSASGSNPSPTMNAGGDDVMGDVISYYTALQTFPPVLDKSFRPSTIDEGLQVYVTINVTNPTVGIRLDSYYVRDVLPACLKVFSGAGTLHCSAGGDIYGGYGVGDAPNSLQFNLRKLDPGETCNFTFKVEAIGPPPCENVTDVPETHGTPVGNAAKANLVVTPVANSNFNGPTSNTDVAGNWVPNGIPGPGSNWSFQIGALQSNVNNTLTGATVDQLKFFAPVTLSGNTIGLSGGIHNFAANTTISVPISVSSDVVIDNDSAPHFVHMAGTLYPNGHSIDFSGAGTTTLSADVNGTGILNVDWGTVMVNYPLTFIGPFNLNGGELDANASVSQQINAFGASTVRGCSAGCGNVNFSDNSDLQACTSSTPLCTASVASLTCNNYGGTVEVSCVGSNTSCSLVNASGAVSSTCGEVKVNFATQPQIGDTVTVIAGTNTGCPDHASATPANIFVDPQCTASKISVIVRAIDGIFRGGFSLGR